MHFYDENGKLIPIEITGPKSSVESSAKSEDLKSINLNKNDKKWLWIGLGIFLLAVIIIFILWLRKKNKKEHATD